MPTDNRRMESSKTGESTSSNQAPTRGEKVSVLFNYLPDKIIKKKRKVSNCAPFAEKYSRFEAEGRG